MLDRIVAQCPICGKDAVFDKKLHPDAKEQPVYIKTKRRNVVLVHRACFEQTTYNYLKEE